MTTKQTGGTITGILALTCEAQESCPTGSPVHVVGDYEVELADGTKPVLGRVSVSNTKFNIGSAFPVADVPGDVTVEARGFAVFAFPASGPLDAGIAVGINGDQQLAAVGAGVAELGILLISSTAQGDRCDVLMR